jgi:hypothetical protein
MLGSLGSGFGQGISTFIWFIAIVVGGVLYLRGRKNRITGSASVLKRFNVSDKPDARVAVEIVGRPSGVISWILTLLRVAPEVELIVTDREVTIRETSLSGIFHTNVPLEKISATVCSYERSILAFWFTIIFGLGFALNLIFGFLEGNRNEIASDMGMAFGFLILAGVAAIVYFLSKKIAIGVETRKVRGVRFKRSVIENITVDLPQALQAIAVINARVLAAQTGQSPRGHLDLSPSSSNTVLVSPAGGGASRCPKCSTLNPTGSQFCENCGSAIYDNAQLRA